MWVVLAGASAVAVLLGRWRRSGQGLVEFLGLGLVWSYARLWHRWHGNGPAPLPAAGPALLVSNHTCSADAAFVTAGCRRPLSFLLAAEYYRIRRVRGLFDYLGCVPVRRDGGDAVAVRAALRRLAAGGVVCVFPEGGLSYAGRGRPRPGKAGAAFLALHSRAPVFLARIVGGPQTTQIGRSWLRPSRVRVLFDGPVDLSAYYGRPIDRKLLAAVSRLLTDRIAGLGEPQPSPPTNAEATMATTQTDLAGKHCAPCEGGVPPLTPEQVRALLPAVPGWKVTADGKRVRREWRVKDFVEAVDFFNRVAKVAEEEDHHPDLHLTGYRNVAIEIGTHAIDGLSENDFILASKIDRLPVELKQ